MATMRHALNIEPCHILQTEINHRSTVSAHPLTPYLTNLTCETYFEGYFSGAHTIETAKKHLLMNTTFDTGLTTLLKCVHTLEGRFI